MTDTKEPNPEAIDIGQRLKDGIENGAPMQDYAILVVKRDPETGQLDMKGRPGAFPVKALGETPIEAGALLFAFLQQVKNEDPKFPIVIDMEAIRPKPPSPIITPAKPKLVIAK